MKFRWFIFIVSLLLVVCGCKEEKEVQDVISISPSMIDTTGGVRIFKVRTSGYWSASTDVDWIIVEPSEGYGNTDVSITIKPDTVTAIGNVIFRTGNKEVVNGEYNEEYVSKVNGEVSEVSYGRIANLKITRRIPYPVYAPRPIDLGLSVKWANFNLGAKSPEQYGYYFDHGALVPNSSVWINDSMFQDNILKPEYDVVTKMLGKDWRLPTYDEYLEISQTLKWKNYYLNGVYGFMGYAANGDSIFFPAAGCILKGQHIHVDRGLYLTSKNYAAPTMTFVSEKDIEGTNNDQHEWRSVRAVYVGK